jgi:hypothetical protein
MEEAGPHQSMFIMQKQIRKICYFNLAVSEVMRKARLVLLQMLNRTEKVQPLTPRGL